MELSNKNFVKQLTVIAKCILLYVVVMHLHMPVMAQGKSIPVVKGIVRNESDEKLSGATVSVPGTKLIVSTKKDGSFELMNVPEGSQIRISYVGYVVSTISLKPGQTELNVRLAPNAAMMNEVVVNTGLYKRPVGNFTGASKSYTGEELKLVNPNNVLKALAAVDPAVRIEQNNVIGSDPNQLPVIQLRGQNNLPVSVTGEATGSTPVSNGDVMSSYLSNPNQPLIILDGFQTTLQTLYDLDINRIANITVLKDASATTAYGSKAANGVIVVETKQPVAGRTQVSYSINFNFQAPDLSSYHLLDAEGLLEAQRLAGVYSDPNNNYNDLALKQWYNYRLQEVKSGVNTYWLSQPVQTGFGTNHSLNISGGGKSIRYTLGLNYNNNVGVMKGSDRNTMGLNYILSYISKDIRLSNTTTINYGRGNNTPWGSFSDYASQFPFFRTLDSTGRMIKIFEPHAASMGFFGGAPGGIFTNAAYNSLLEIKDYSSYTSFTNNTNFEWRISNNIRMRSAVGITTNQPGAELFLPADHTSFVNASGAGLEDFGSYNKTRGANSVIDGRLNFDYNKRFGKHNVLLAVGAQAQATNSSSTSIRVSGLPNDYTDQLGMADGFGTSLKPVATKSTTHTVSSFASASYNYADRYTAELTTNVSGSSQFGENNRFAPFWAGGLSWSLDKEKFFVKNPVIQQLRVRATTGITGNQNFGAYLGQSIYQYNLQNNYRLQLGTVLQGYANPNLKWQQTFKNNIGIVAGLFNGLLNVSLDLFEETTDNLILPLDVAPSTGFPNYRDNLGATKNTGYEVSVSMPLIKNRNKNIFWTLTMNAGHYENVVTELSPAIELLNKAGDSTGVKQKKPQPRYQVGQSLTRIWAVKSLGIDPATGKEVYQKLDGSKTFVWDPADKVVCGDGAAKLKGMIASNLTYKGFTFNITLSYQYGGQMYNQTLVDKIENVDLYHFNADERVLTERWKKPGDISSYKSLVANGALGNQATYATSRFVQDDNFLDASSITVGYTFPSNLGWVRKMRLSTPRLFVTQNNVFRLATIQTERGTSYPFARSFSFGLATTF